MSSNGSVIPAGNSTPITAEPPTHAEFVANGIIESLIGSISIFINALTAIVIIKTKDMRSPCFMIIAAHAIFDSIMSIGFFTNGIELCGYAFQFLNISFSRLKCYLMYLTMLITTPASSIMTTVLGIDRMMAILCPLVYKRLGIRFTIGSILAASVVGCGAAIACYVTLPQPISAAIMCFNFKTPYNPTYTSVQTNFNLFCYTLSVLLYIAITIIVKYKKAKKSGQNAQSTEIQRFLQRQLKLIPLINALAILYSIFGLVPALISLIFPLIAGGRYVQRAWYYGSMLKVCLSSVDFFVMFLKSAKFRIGLKRLLGMKCQVSPISRGGTTGGNDGQGRGPSSRKW